MTAAERTIDGPEENAQRVKMIREVLDAERSGELTERAALVAIDIVCRNPAIPTKAEMDYADELNNAERTLYEQAPREWLVEHTKQADEAHDFLSALSVPECIHDGKPHDCDSLADRIQWLAEGGGGTLQEQAEVERLRERVARILQAAEDIYGAAARRDIEAGSDE